MQIQSTTLAAIQNPSLLLNIPSEEEKVTPTVLNRLNLRSFIEKQEGKIISVDFIKANGEHRTLTGRLGVISYLHGGENRVESEDRPYLTIFDLKQMGYRTVNLQSVSRLRAQHKVYEIR